MRKRIQRGNEHPGQHGKIGETGTGVCEACTASMMASLEKKPEKPGNPISASEPDQRSPIRDRHVFPQAAHIADVLIMMHGDDHRTGAEEQQRLEKSVRHEMEDAGGISRGAQGHCHIAQVATASSRRPRA